MARSWALALFVALGSGCAFTNVNMQLPTEPAGDRKGIGMDRAVSVVVPFTDGRSITHRCGMQKNGYNMDTANATCDQSPTEWFARRLLSELDVAGFRAIAAIDTENTSNDSTTTDPARVEGSLLKLFVEPVIGAWTASLEADLHVRLRVTRPDGLEAEREFFSKGVKPGQMASVTPAFESALRRATTTMMDEMVVGIAQLLDDHPQASGGSP